ncbi:helix-turn-helix domain-containing protein [Acidisoma sp. 7E03]
MAASPALPIFYLYGEPHQAVEDAFVHLEALDDRSRPSEWTIRRHLHVELNHLFVLTAGGGQLLLDDSEIALAAPCLLLVPAGVAHGFRWEEQSAGYVITLASSHLETLTNAYPELRALFRHAMAMPLAEVEITAVRSRIADMTREYSWSAPGRRAAIDAALLGLCVTALRGIGPANSSQEPAAGRQAGLVARLRQRIEERYRLHEPISAYAEALGVTPFQLRAACRAVARLSPSEMIEQRLMLEAKRSLRYSTLSISDVALSLGFEDLAYFSRFFRRHGGCSPRAFRGGRRLVG